MPVETSAQIVGMSAIAMTRPCAFENANKTQKREKELQDAKTASKLHFSGLKHSTRLAIKVLKYII